MSSGSSSSNSNSTTSSDDDEKKKKARMPGGKKSKVLPRPNVGTGWWLCIVLPCALTTYYYRSHPQATCNLTLEYNKLTLAAWGMCIESLCFFIYMQWHIGLFVKLLVSFIPGLLTSVAYILIFVPTSWLNGFIWGFMVTLTYQFIYIRVLRGLPHCFSFGEAAILVQGLGIFLLNVIPRMPIWLAGREKMTNDFQVLNVIMMSALFCLFLACLLLYTTPTLRKPFKFYQLMISLLLLVTCLPVTTPKPVFKLLDFLLANEKRLLIIGFYFVLVALTILVIWWQLRKNTAKASTRMRKVFHLLIVLVYVPGILYEFALLYIASGIAFAIFTILELFRILNMPPLANVLRNAFASFSDEKDAGILALTPFSLLLGCSMPLWISPCANTYDLLPLFSGILAVGIGDTAASVIGSKFGRLKWPNSSRSIEGTISFMIAILLSVLGLQLTGYVPMTQSTWFVTIQATLITALVEAHTDQIDNLVLPLIFYTIINLC